MKMTLLCIFYWQSYSFNMRVLAKWKFISNKHFSWTEIRILLSKNTKKSFSPTLENYPDHHRNIQRSYTPNSLQLTSNVNKPLLGGSNTHGIQKHIDRYLGVMGNPTFKANYWCGRTNLLKYLIKHLILLSMELNIPYYQVSITHQNPEVQDPTTRHKKPTDITRKPTHDSSPIKNHCYSISTIIMWQKLICIVTKKTKKKCVLPKWLWPNIGWSVWTHILVIFLMNWTD